MLHCGTCGLVVGLLFVFLDSPGSQMRSDSSYWTMGTASLTPSLGSHCRTVTQRICIAEGEEISSSRMNHPSVCGNSCVVSKKLRKTNGLCCTPVYWKGVSELCKIHNSEVTLPSPTTVLENTGHGWKTAFWHRDLLSRRTEKLS